ncbi:uncharacterized protein LOC123345439 isoform X1 [Mauremys mutica]|uniref:uncharacterized protein LOC123345439 isoform X1 n=1 Tax=Mauremys mutica TaxID=74926 RepID=UPI001D164617|nr:uncharacterized protein LOC123345439 isoform X1 [Mauremys mutica]
MPLRLLLLPWAWGALASSPPVTPVSVTLRVLHIDVFHNASSTDMAGMALLGDLETHSLACSTCEIRFLQPWARQGLTPKQWQDLELLIHRYLFNFNRTVIRIAQQQGQGYPFVTQGSLGCELHPNGTSRGFYDAAVNGENFISFDVDGGTWVARQGDKLGALYTRDLLIQNKGATITLQFLLRTTCVNQLNTFVQYGRESLERQERPVAVVFARAPPPAGPPAPVLLVCRVTGFYPRPVRVAWLQDGEEVVPGWWLNSSGILPNADLTYQLRSSLGVEPGAGHSYACRVQHSSLGGQSLLIPWEQSRPWGPGLAVGITLGVVAVAAVAVVLWWRRRRVPATGSCGNRAEQRQRESEVGSEGRGLQRNFPDARQSPDPPSPARMLLALLLLPWAWGALAASPPVPTASVTLWLLQIDVFHNASSMDMWGMALLGDLETHSMACSTCEIRFLQPWARQGLTPKQWQDLELLIHRYLFNFNRTVTRIAQQQGMGYPFVTQGSLGCELHPNGTSRGFYDAGVNGDDFISFDADAGKWVARQGDNVAARYTRDLLNQDKGTASALQFLLRTTCVNEIKSFVQHGRESLERQERPVAVVFARAPPPAGTPTPVLLVCRVTGFYPRPVRVAWLQDGEEVVPGWWLNSSGILPNADLTYQLRSSLGVEPGAGHSYACRVQHSSLGGQSLLIPWEQSRPWGPGLAVGITLGVVAVAAVAVVLWRSRRRGYQDVRPEESRP